MILMEHSFSAPSARHLFVVMRPSDALPWLQAKATQRLGRQKKDKRAEVWCSRRRAQGTEAAG